MAGRLTDLDVDVIQQTGNKGRLTDLDVDVIQVNPRRGRVTDLDVDVVQVDPTEFNILSSGGGWGFIPMGF